MEMEIIFNNMPTILLKSHFNLKSKKQHKENVESHRDVPQMLFIEDKINKQNQLPQIRSQKYRHLQLPSIYLTEQMRDKKEVRTPFFDCVASKGGNVGRGKESERKLTMHRPLRIEKENFGRLQTEERRRHNSVSRIYHNFINKKKDKKNNYMCKILDKVVSEDIEPWNIQNSFVRGKYKPQQKYSMFERKDMFNGSSLWEREILGSYNMRVDPN